MEVHRALSAQFSGAPGGDNMMDNFRISGFQVPVAVAVPRYLPTRLRPGLRGGAGVIHHSLPSEAQAPSLQYIITSSSYKKGTSGIFPTSFFSF